MEYKVISANIRIIEAAPEHKIYRRSEPVETAYFTDTVYLGAGDSRDNYAELTDAEVADIEARRRKDALQDSDNNESQEKELHHD